MRVNEKLLKLILGKTDTPIQTVTSRNVIEAKRQTVLLFELMHE